MIAGSGWVIPLKLNLITPGLEYWEHWQHIGSHQGEYLEGLCQLFARVQRFGIRAGFFEDLEYRYVNADVKHQNLLLTLFNQVSNPDEVRKEDAEPQAHGHQMQKSQTTKIQRIGL